MSKSANPGELRTPVQFKTVTSTIDDEGDPCEVETNVFGEGKNVYCKWVNAHGTEVYMAMQQQLKEPATLTCRYSPLINETLLVYKGSDTKPYEIISVDNVEDRNAWLEITVQRKVPAR